MKTEQDVDDLVTVWTRYSDDPVTDLVYSDERPSTKEKVISLIAICVVLGVVIYFCLPLLGVY